MDLKNIPLPEVYVESQDFRFFREWFVQALEKTKYDTENIFDLYDPLRCPEELVWLLADTMGFRYDDRLPTAFNRLVLIYFMSMIYNRGSKDGVILAAEVNLAQFRILQAAEADINGSNDNIEKADSILYNRLEDTTIPVNAASVIPHTAEGYIDVVYFSKEVPKDACVEYVRPLGMFCFSYAGVRFDAKAKISVDARLTNSDDVGMSYGPTQVGHYRRADYARLQKTITPTENDTTDTRNPVWYRNSDYEDIAHGDGTYESGTDPNMNPGYRALNSLQLSNNEEVVMSLLGPIFSLGYGPQDVDTVYPDDYYKEPLMPDAYNLRYDKQMEEDNTPIHDGEYDIYTIDDDRSPSDPELGILDPRPRINPLMAELGDAISMNDLNTEYAGDIPWEPVDENDYIYEITNGEATVLYYIGTGIAVQIPATLGGAPVTKLAPTAFNYTNVKYVDIPDSVVEIG